MEYSHGLEERLPAWNLRIRDSAHEGVLAGFLRGGGPWN